MGEEIEIPKTKPKEISITRFQSSPNRPFRVALSGLGPAVASLIHSN